MHNASLETDTETQIQNLYETAFHIRDNTFEKDINLSCLPQLWVNSWVNWII